MRCEVPLMELAQTFAELPYVEPVLAKTYEEPKAAGSLSSVVQLPERAQYEEHSEPVLTAGEE